MTLIAKVIEIFSILTKYFNDKQLIDAGKAVKTLEQIKILNEKTTLANTILRDSVADISGLYNDDGYKRK